MATSPHKPSLLVAIGVGPKKGPAAPPPPSWDDDGDDASTQDGSDTPQQPDPSADPSQAGGQKVSPEEAGAYTADEKCVACKYYIHQGHMCQKVDGNQFGLTVVGCDLFEPEDSDEPDGDEGDPSQMAAPAPQGAQYGGSNTSQSGQ